MLHLKSEWQAYGVPGVRQSARGLKTAGQKIWDDVPLHRQLQAQQPALVSFAVCSQNFYLLSRLNNFW